MVSCDRRHSCEDRYVEISRPSSSSSAYDDSPQRKRGSLLALRATVLQFVKRSTTPALCLCLFVFCDATAGYGAQKHTLLESTEQSPVYDVDVQLKVNGQLQTAAGPEKAVSLPLDVKAKLQYRERRLSGAGRQARALRSLRSYDHAEAEIKVQQQTTFSKLSSQKLIVAQGRREGPLLYDPEGPLTPRELDLLRVPGDSLALLGLLPVQPVAVGDEWTPDSWAVQMLTGTEAVLKSKLTCRLEKVDKDVATVQFQGEIEGATVGAATTIKLDGRYQFDLKCNAITHAALKQTEKRSAGSVNPGMDVTAEVVVDRIPAANPGPLTARRADQVPLEPTAEQLRLRLHTRWDAALLLDRDWHVFHQSGEQAILRLLDKGSLIAQCNVARIAAANPGNHTSERDFSQDIARSLGEKLKEIGTPERLDADKGWFLCKVTAKGEANDTPIRWIYYLSAAPDGRQATFVFTVEDKLLERLADRDLSLVKSLKFLDPQRAPVQAAQPREVE